MWVDEEMENRRIHDEVNINKVAKKLGYSHVLESIIYDFDEEGIFPDKNFLISILSQDDTQTNKARRLLCYIIQSIDNGHLSTSKTAEIFLKRGQKEIAEHFNAKLVESLSTRDNSSTLNGDLFTLPNFHSRYSLPTIFDPRILQTLPNATQSYPKALNELVHQPFEVRVTPAQHIFGGENNDDIYKNSSIPRGYVFLVNNSDFEDETFKSRIGSHIDVANLKSVFTQMGYIVEPHCNLTCAEMKKELKDFSESKKLDNVDSCIIIIMSHGVENYIITSDNRRIDWNDVRDYFSNSNCPQLCDKPKIFIFQCCRGITPDVGVEMKPTVLNVENKPFNSSLLSTDGVAMGHTVPITTYPTHTDMFIIFATIEGYVAYLNRERGSWLVEALCIEFMEHAHNTDLDALMKKVSLRLKNFHSDDGRKQTAELRSYAFTNHFYFNPQPLSSNLHPHIHQLSDDFLSQRISSPVLRVPPQTPPHQRRHLKWKNASIPATPEPTQMSSNGNYFDFNPNVAVASGINNGALGACGGQSEINNEPLGATGGQPFSTSGNRLSYGWRFGDSNDNLNRSSNRNYLENMDVVDIPCRLSLDLRDIYPEDVPPIVQTTKPATTPTKLNFDPPMVLDTRLEYDPSSYKIHRHMSYETESSSRRDEHISDEARCFSLPVTGRSEEEPDFIHHTGAGPVREPLKEKNESFCDMGSRLEHCVSLPTRELGYSIPALTTTIKASQQLFTATKEEDATEISSNPVEINSESTKTNLNLMEINSNSMEINENEVSSPVKAWELPQIPQRSSSDVLNFNEWRRQNCFSSSETCAGYTLKRQLSIPSESEAMTKLHGIKNYLQDNEMDDLIKHLDPIHDVIVKKKQKHKKKKPHQN